MAIWQFSLYLIPNAAIKERFNETPSKLSMDVAEDTRWWSGYQPCKGFEEAISQMLPESSSWSKSLRIWGAERSDSILVGYVTEEKLEVEEVEVRIDVSHLSANFVAGICKWAMDLNCIARTKMHEVVRPDYFAIQDAITNSRAMRFLEDPEATLGSLRNEEFERNE